MKNSKPKGIGTCQHCGWTGGLVTLLNQHGSKCVKNPKNMNKLPTAEELLEEFADTQYTMSRNGKEKAIEAMIQFAKLHVEAALKAASEKAYAQSSSSNITSKDWTEKSQGLICVHLGRVLVNKNSILTAYPFSNIK
jgi:hypothetical protein